MRRGRSLLRYVNLPFMAAALFFFSCISLLYLSRSEVDGVWPVIALFSIPVVQSFFSVRNGGVLAKRFSLIISACCCALLAFWFLYILVVHFMQNSGLLMTSLSWVSGICSVLVMGSVLYFTKLLLDASSKTNGEAVKFREDLRRKAFLYITSFLAIFLYVTFFLTFSLAFHDQYLLSLSKESGGTLNAEGVSRGLVTNVPKYSEGADEGQAISSSMVEKLFFQDKVPPVLEVDFNLIAVPLASLKGGTNQQREAENARVIDRIVAELLRDKRYTRTDVIIRGHSSKTPIRVGSREYSSNEAFSLARAKEVEAKIRERLRSKTQQSINAWFDPVGAGAQGSYLDDKQRCASNLFKGEPCVEVRIDRLLGDLTELQYRALKDIHELTLFDYVYFMIYTITTTGYGDIQPASSQAKLLSSIANLYELFFIVIFFNVVLAASSGSSLLVTPQRREKAVLLDGKWISIDEPVVHALAGQILIRIEINDSRVTVKMMLPTMQEIVFAALSAGDRRVFQHSGKDYLLDIVEVKARGARISIIEREGAVRGPSERRLVVDPSGTNR